MIYIYVDSQRIQHYSNVLPLLVSLVQIEDGGSLEIGSSDCPFEGRAEILLTGEIKTCLLFSTSCFPGKRGSYNTDNGEKFIAVEAGGRLEIHGQQRRLAIQRNEKKIMNNIVGHGLSWLPLLGKDEGQEGLR